MAPPTPVIATVTVSASSAIVSWGTVIDDNSGIAGYQVLDYVGSAVETVGVPTSAGDTQTCTIPLGGATGHTFCVVAIDVAGNRSTSSVFYPSSASEPSPARSTASPASAANPMSAASAPSAASAVNPASAASAPSAASAASAVENSAHIMFDDETPGLTHTALSNPPAPPAGYVAIPGTSFDVSPSGPMQRQCDRGTELRSGEPAWLGTEYPDDALPRWCVARRDH